MSEVSVATLIFSIAGIVFIVLGLPLSQERVGVASEMLIQTTNSSAGRGQLPRLALDTQRKLLRGST